MHQVEFSPFRGGPIARVQSEEFYVGYKSLGEFCKLKMIKMIKAKAGKLDLGSKDCRFAEKITYRARQALL